MEKTDTLKTKDRLQYAQDYKTRMTDWAWVPPKSQQGINKAYDDWADTYEKEVLSVNYAAPRQLAEYFHKYASQLGLSKDCEILDVGAGTGWAGQELKKLGYTNVDGVDPCEKMFQQAREKQVYRKYMSFAVGDSPMPIQDASYGAVVICGSMPLMTAPGLKDMIRVIRPGGLFVSVGAVKWLSTCNKWTMLTLHQLLEEGIVKKLEIDIPKECYNMDQPSLVLVYQKL